MRRIINIIFIASSMLLVSSCSILDVEPAMSISEKGAVSTKRDVMNALNGCYDALQLTGYYGRDMVAIGDIPTDNLDATGTIADFRAIDLFNHKADNSIVLNLWSSMYDAINRINNVLYRIDRVQGMLPEEILNVKAELLFLRALHYFNLVRLWGDVPYRDMPTQNSEDALHVPRTNKNTVYQNILDDLDFALISITATSKIKANSWAIKALQAKIHLTLQNYTQAYAISNDIITNGPFSLTTYYDDIFSFTDESEIIFMVDFNEQDWTRLAQYFAPNLLGGKKRVLAHRRIGCIIQYKRC